MGQKYAAYNTSGQLTGFYDSVDSPVPSGVTAIEITEAQWQAALASPYPVTVANGVLTIPTGPTLAQAQSAQLSLIAQSQAQAVASVPVTIGGVSYQVDNSPARQAQNLGYTIIANGILSTVTAWASGATIEPGGYCQVGGVVMFSAAGGTTGTTAPTAPTTFGTPVTDNTVSWELFGRRVYLTDGKYVWFTAQELLSAFTQGELYLHGVNNKAELLNEQIMAATTVSSVQTYTF